MNYSPTRKRKRRSLRIAPVLITLLLLVILFQGAIHLWQKAGLTQQGSIAEHIQHFTNNIQTQFYSEDVNTPWNLALINRWHPLPENYEIDLVSVPGGEEVDARIYDPLMEMLDAATAEGLEPIVVSGYRTQEEQQQLYDEKIKDYQNQGYSKNEAIALAEQWTAAPGASEHQLGLAVDINGATYDIYLWLQENSYQYGFIFRYPGNKTDLTGVAEEVWHYRYVGIDAATAIHEQGICLEEYLEQLNV